MNQTLQLGPLAFPFALLLAMAALALGLFAGRALGRRTGVDPEPLLWRLLAVGAIAARLAFVLQFHDAYLKAPLQILDVRDGGWTPLAGFAAAAIYAIACGLRRAPLRSPLAAALGTVTIVWAVGTLVLGALSGEVGRLPALRLQALDGRTVALADFQGKPTVLNLWATWCPPCRREMPVLLQAQGQRPEVNFVFLNQGESGPTVQAFLAAQGLPLRNVLLDARGEAGIQLGHRALPTTLFFDAQGRLVDTRVGELSPATLDQRLAAASPSSPTK
ncbi:redoxin family protein [Caenimonas terrae]|uniref:Redoxin family protein n=1 Tax=Caenimonas terrae TaxID=696074 RepID=A0ABW0NAD0_9BURK